MISLAGCRVAKLALKLDVQSDEQTTSRLSHLLGPWGPGVLRNKITGLDLIRYIESPREAKTRPCPNQQIGICGEMPKHWCVLNLLVILAPLQLFILFSFLSFPFFLLPLFWGLERHLFGRYAWSVWEGILTLAFNSEMRLLPNTDAWWKQNGALTQWCCARLPDGSSIMQTCGHAQQTTFR